MSVTLISPTKKNRVDLNNYEYARDIENRILISQLTLFEADILEEILSSSLKFTSSGLAENLGVKVEAILPMLKKMMGTKLLEQNGDNILVCKEMRKYYEFQFQKFDNAFEPNLEFIQDLLKKVPIQVLPAWYFIPRTSDSIFDSLIEKFFATPQVYERYLEELNFEDPVLTGIMHDVFAAPDFKIRSRSLREKYTLTRREFEEYMLHLEFNFVCFLSYNRIEEENGWKEVVTPFHEWRQFLQEKERRTPQPIENIESIEHLRSQPFSFLRDAKVILKLAHEHPLSVEPQRIGKRQIPSQALIKEFLANAEDIPANVQSKMQKYESYLSRLLSKLTIVGLLEEDGAVLKASSDVQQWLDTNEEDLSLHLYRHPANQVLHFADLSEDLCVYRNFREIEKAIQNLNQGEWIPFNNFLASITAPIGNRESVTLKKVGRRWAYEFPTYPEEEKNFVRAALEERLAETGMVDWGSFEGEPCFRLTAFGKSILGID